MKIDVITLFPEMFKGVFDASIIKRARQKGYIQLNLHNLREYSNDKHKKVDDRPFGGGPGMILQPQPIFDVVNHLKSRGSKVILLSPQGEIFTQGFAKELSKFSHLIFVCGHYEGIDERVRKYLIDMEFSIGDYILSGGEVPAMVLVDSIVRLIPGVLGNKDSAINESFCNNTLEYPQYTRPADFRGMKVPDILLSGDHKKIKDWREQQSMKKTKKDRPELLKL